MPIYMVQAADSGAVKIGFTSEDAYVGRFTKMQVDNHEELTVLRLLQGGKGAEAMLHRIFAHLRIRGEWFAFHTAMLDHIGLPEWVPPTPMQKPRLSHKGWSRSLSPEERSRRSIQGKAVWADPEKRAARLAKAKATNALRYGKPGGFA